jgi:hypothetical protein
MASKYAKLFGRRKYYQVYQRESVLRHLFDYKRLTGLKTARDCWRTAYRVGRIAAAGMTENTLICRHLRGLEYHSYCIVKMRRDGQCDPYKMSTKIMLDQLRLIDEIFGELPQKEQPE